MADTMSHTEQRYRLAVERYAELGVDVEAALAALERIALSLPCWQGDDVGGFERAGGLSDGGILATGNYPGKARNGDELREDAAAAFGLIPGRHRFNLHAMYLEADGEVVDRPDIEPGHFARWRDWAADRGVALDFNPTFFSHPLAAAGQTLSAADESIRRYWVEHGRASRRVAAALGRELQSPAVNNVWIPDGQKDVTIDRAGPRRRLRQSLDEMFDEPLDAAEIVDSVEAKLFGIGSESYVVGSHEFYLGYAVSRRMTLCLDAGHFHPTESVADKLSSALEFVPRVLLHLSRGVRWDSDHIVLQTDEVRAIAEEVVRGGLLDRVLVGLDFFDATIQRVAAWVIGARATQQAFLAALLEPIELLRMYESSGDFTARLALVEHARTLPAGDVWEQFCLRNDVPPGWSWLEQVREHERRTTAARSAAPQFAPTATTA